MKNKTLIKLGKKIRKERLKRNLAQEKLAEIVGVHRNYIGMIERAETNVTILNLVKIAKALGVTPSRLLNF